MLLSGHHANCCSSPWINKIVIIKGVWENGKKLCFNAIFGCLIRYSLWLIALFALCWICVWKDWQFFICPSHLSTLLQVTWVLLLSVFVCCFCDFSIVHWSDCKWLFASLPWDIVEERNVNDLKKWSFILQYLMSWLKMSKFLAAVSSGL